jgi:hypothetical protein
MNNIQEIEVVENLLKLGNFQRMFRVNFSGWRIYIDPLPFKYYSGLTGALDAATFTGDIERRRLKGWREAQIDSYGRKGADEMLEFMGDFGTLLHMAGVTIKNNGCLNWNEEKDRATEFFIGCYRKKYLEPDYKVIRSMVYDYQKHAAALMQWIYERVQTIYAIETPARWEHLQIATPIDMFCDCRQTPKGDFKNTTVNLKTSASITKGHMKQVACEFQMWNETYGDIEAFSNGVNLAECTAIMRTTNWREASGPSYDYKYLNGDEAREIALNCAKKLELCLNDPDSSYLREPKSKVFDGICKAGEQPKIIIKTLEEEWQEVQTQQE